MLTIRLQRTGRKHEPTFRIVLTDSKNSPKSGRYLEVLGSYDPRKSNEIIKEDRIKHWISMGAKTSGTVHNLLVSKKVVDGKKVNVLPKKSPIKDPNAATAAAAAPAEAAPAEPASEPASEAEAPAEEPAA